MQSARQPNFPRTSLVFPQDLWVQWKSGDQKGSAQVIGVGAPAVLLHGPIEAEALEKITLQFPQPGGSIHIEGVVRKIEPYVVVEYIAMEKGAWVLLLEMIKRLENEL